MEWQEEDEWPIGSKDTCGCSCEEHNKRPAPKPPDPGGPLQPPLGPAQAQPYLQQSLPCPIYSVSAMEQPPPPDQVPTLKGETPRDLRNKAEKQRRDNMNKAVNELSKIVPPVVAMNRKVDKTSVLRLTAHYLRSHQHVFGDSLDSLNQFGAASVEALLYFMNGFIITTTYKGLMVVISPNVENHLGYTELELIGHNITNIIHEDDHQLMLDQILPKSFLLGPNDEILFPEDPEAREKVGEALKNEKRSFNIRFKKNVQRSAPNKYINCNIQGSFRKSDRACQSEMRRCQLVRRLRARGQNWMSSGNDVVFIGLVRPYYETFITESKLDSSLMEYRTRHSVDGEIINCDSRISIVTGYMASEVQGINAMNFMHRDDVRWVIVALREMYDNHRLSGESCYRLMTKCGSFVYMRTKGFLEVDKSTGAVTSFVCINTVVDNEEGKQLNLKMKKKYMVLVNNTDETPPEDDDEEVNERQGIPVEDPRQLQKVILHLVTNLPSPSADTTQSNSPFREERSPYRLSIIPPKKERIVNAIDKIYNVIQRFKFTPKTVRYKKEKVSKTLQIEEDPFGTMASNSDEDDKTKESEKPESGSDPPKSNNNQPVPDNDTVIQTIDPFTLYPDLIPGTTTEISPQAGPSGLQRPIDPLVLRRLYITEQEYNTENQTAQVSCTIQDSTKTYAVMIPAIVTGKFCDSRSSTPIEANRPVQPVCPTPDVNIDQPATTDASKPLQNSSNPEPSSSNMGVSNISARSHYESFGQMQASLCNQEVPTAYDYPPVSTYFPNPGFTYPYHIPFNQPTWYYDSGSWYYVEKWPQQLIQADPSRPPHFRNYPIPHYVYPFDASRQQAFPTYPYPSNIYHQYGQHQQYHQQYQQHEQYHQQYQQHEQYHQQYQQHEQYHQQYQQHQQYHQQYQQPQPQAEVKRHYYTTETDAVPRKRQHVGTDAAPASARNPNNPYPKYPKNQCIQQQENIPQHSTSTQEDLLSFLDGSNLVSSTSLAEAVLLDDSIGSNMSSQMQRHGGTSKGKEPDPIWALFDDDCIDRYSELPDTHNEPRASIEQPSNMEVDPLIQIETEELNRERELVNVMDIEESIQYLATQTEIIRALESLRK